MCDGLIWFLDFKNSVDLIGLLYSGAVYASVFLLKPTSAQFHDPQLHIVPTGDKCTLP